MKLNTRFYVISFIIVAAMLTRILPHIPNFTALGAIALFGAAQYQKKIMAFLIPITALIASDAILGFYGGAYWVYGTFAIITCIGFALRNNLTIPRLIGAALLSSLCVFIFTDIGVWMGTMYAHTWAGLIECYAAALPFLRNEVLGDVFYCGVLFGGFYLAQRRFPTLAKANS